MTVLLDLIGRNKIKLTLQGTFVGVGIFTAVVAGAGAMWFFFICKERVMQSVERPSIKAGIKSIINNKPILLMTLSKMLSGFSVGGSKSDYLIDVLNFASLNIITGIPGSINQPHQLCDSSVVQTALLEPIPVYHGYICRRYPARARVPRRLHRRQEARTL